MPEKVLIVDDHPIMLAGLRGLLSGEPDIELCGEADSASAALEAIELHKPTLLILDLFLGDDSDANFVSSVHSRWPDLKILVVSMQNEAVFAERVIAMGARGYIMKNETAPLILAAARKVSAGEYYVSPALRERLYARKSRRQRSSQTLNPLTAREQQILGDIAIGRGTQEIARRLGINSKTVDSHRRSMREKLGLRSPADLLQYAVHWAQTNETAKADDATGS